MPDGERIIGSWRAVEGDLSAVLNEDDLGPRHGTGTGFRETAIADGLVCLRVTPTRLIGTITAGATGDGHVRGSGVVGMDAARHRMGRDQGLEFYWPLVDIDLVGLLKTKKYLRWWDHEFYVQCEDPRAVLQLRIVSPNGPGKDWAVQRGLTGQSGSLTSMDGLAQCLVEAVTAARGGPPRRKRTSGGLDEETGWLWAIPKSRSVWHDDPTGRYPQRWWDGTGWTSLVFTTDNAMAVDDHQDQSHRYVDPPKDPPDGPESDPGGDDGRTGPSPEPGIQPLAQTDALAPAVEDPALPTSDNSVRAGRDRVLPPLPDRAKPVVVVDDPLRPMVSTHKSQARLPAVPPEPQPGAMPDPGPVDAPDRQDRGKRRRVIAAAAAVVVVAAGAAWWAATITGDETATYTGDGTISVGSAPSGVAVGEGAVWVANFGDDSVSRVDPASGEVTDTIPVGDNPRGVAVGEGAVWVANSFDDSVSRVDPATGEVTDTIPVGDNPSGIVVGEGAVWVANSFDDSVSRVDPASGEVTGTIPVRDNPRGVAVGEGAVWVTSSDGAVSRVGPASGEVTDTIPVSNATSGVAVGEGAVWVTNTNDGTVSRVDPVSGEVTDTIPVRDGLSGVAVGEGAVWVASSGDDSVSRVDPASGEVTDTIPVGDTLFVHAVAVGEGAVWVTNSNDGTVSRVDPASGEVTDTPDVASTVPDEGPSSPTAALGASADPGPESLRPDDPLERRLAAGTTARFDLIDPGLDVVVITVTGSDGFAPDVRLIEGGEFLKSAQGAAGSAVTLSTPAAQGVLYQAEVRERTGASGDYTIRMTREGFE